MTPYELIKAKRDGAVLADAELEQILKRYTAGELPDYQMAALLMAIFFRGMNDAELVAWTSAMLHSGEVLDLSDLAGVKVDKHSTGGVGDKVSLALAPMVAACGVLVPMIAGRGLGHTGGTLDKLESIPGFRVDLSTAQYRRQVREVGACIIGQTKEIAPADKKLYALRDVTATVDCIPLIASSIMSKKLAEGIDALVLDVKVGSGAFMKRLADARALARALIGIGKQMGKQVTALLTSMEQPLGRAVGNALEVEEAVAILRGEAPTDVTEVTMALGAEMLVLGKACPDRAAARARLDEAVQSGRALEKLKVMVKAQHGDPEAIDDLSKLPRAKQTKDVSASSAGYVEAIDAEAVGVASVVLGAGRLAVDSKIDPSVGFTLLKKVGEQVEIGEPLVRIHYNGDSALAEVVTRVVRAYKVGERPTKGSPSIVERL